MNKKKDRRSQRTRHLLSAALVALIREKEYHTITVSDIIERANVGRSTFYAHYRDKDDLFVGEIDRLIEVLSKGILHKSNGEDHLLPSLGLFRHVGEEYDLYKALAWGPGIDLLIKHLQKSLSEKVETSLKEGGSEFSIPIPVLANYIIGSFLTLLKWWLDNKMMYSPEQIDEMFRKLTLAGIEKARI